MPLNIEDNTDKYVSEAQILKYIREQRHDFINHIQVIWGYLQLNKIEFAKMYIIELNNKFNILNRIFKIYNPALSLFFYDCVRKAYKLGVEVDFEADELSIESFSIHDNFINILKVYFEKILSAVLNSEGCKKIYIDLYIEDGNLFISMSNNIYDCHEEAEKECLIDLIDEENIKMYSKSKESCMTYIIKLEC